MISDRQLVEDYRSGQQAGLEHLIDRYRDDLFRFCCHLSLDRQEAEDLFQEVWVRVLRKLEKYDPERPFKAWLFQVTVNLHKDRYRKWKKLRERLTLAWTDDNSKLSEPGDGAPLTEDFLLKKEEFLYLEQCLRTLPKRYLAPLILFYYEEFSYESIGEVLDVPLGTVKSRLNQGKKLLKAAMGGRDHEATSG
ncbi:RNA polymerase sigma factor [Paenibacillus camerounensis]|uniref:RNA polymerase sigma factor n=1 Tax=Paenibacillus camerounensis TaxID=1243663 RepID=UPI0005A71686|nr:RNA polymerase sigma factor [Paenibacillus camerounensis]